MVSRRKIAATAVASFGAAMTSIYVAPELQADIIDLSFSPTTVTFDNILPVVINEIGATFLQFNGANKTILGSNIQTLNLVQSSQTLVASTFTGSPLVFLTYSATGTAYIGFKFNENVGWFSLNLGGPMGDITYLGGEYGSMGEAVHVGGTGIPEPSAMAGLALLALGATGVRRNRKK